MIVMPKSMIARCIFNSVTERNQEDSIPWTCFIHAELRHKVVAECAVAWKVTSITRNGTSRTNMLIRLGFKGLSPILRERGSEICVLRQKKERPSECALV